eukprot:scaffold21882_cov34-Isochrysis_galbana.AAC.1
MRVQTPPTQGTAGAHDHRSPIHTAPRSHLSLVLAALFTPAPPADRVPSDAHSDPALPLFTLPLGWT